jgi:hypothetical protein
VTSLGIREVVERFGTHAATRLGLDLASEGGPERWFVAACLLSGRDPEATALEAARRLAGAGLDHPAALAPSGAEATAAALDAAGVRRAEEIAARLARASRRLLDRHGGGFGAMAAEAGSLVELGAAVAALAPGVGRATVLRFLRPMREVWPAAAEVPLDPAARAAALHLGWLADTEDEEGAPAALRRRLLVEDEAPPFADVEAALARLGARACLRGRPERCPLGPACPARPERPAAPPLSHDAWEGAPPGGPSRADLDG